MLHTAVTLLVWPSYVSTAWLLPEATSNKRMWGLPAAASRRLSVVISSLLTCAGEHPCEDVCIHVAFPTDMSSEELFRECREHRQH